MGQEQISNPNLEIPGKKPTLRRLLPLYRILMNNIVKALVIQLRTISQLFYLLILLQFYTFLITQVIYTNTAYTTE